MLLLKFHLHFHSDDNPTTHVGTYMLCERMLAFFTNPSVDFNYAVKKENKKYKSTLWREK